MSDGNHLVLIVEDTEDVAGIMRLTLEQVGLQTHHAPNGPRALEFLETRFPDAMVLDIGMPGMSGWEVLEEIKARYPEATFPVIVLTAFDDPANKLIGKLQARVFRYMTKPFDPTTLIQTVREALGVTG